MKVGTKLLDWENSEIIECAVKPLALGGEMNGVFFLLVIYYQ